MTGIGDMAAAPADAPRNPFPGCTVPVVDNLDQLTGPTQGRSHLPITLDASARAT